MFIAGFRDDDDEINAVNAREDLKKAVRNQPINVVNSTATEDNLRNTNEWDVSHVTDMSDMFFNVQFNQPINNWDVINVTNMTRMYTGSSFNHPLDRWDVINVTNMQGTFSRSQFDHPLNSWQVDNVTNMSGMFMNSQYNNPLDTWNVDNVTNMTGMFMNSQYNNTLDTWNVDNVTNMTGMFFNSQFAQSFDELPGTWDLTNVSDSINIFRDPDESEEEYFEDEDSGDEEPSWDGQPVPSDEPSVEPPEFVINTVETEISSRTYNLDISVYDPVMLEYKTIRQVFEGKNSNDEVEEDEDEIKDNIIILNNDLTTGSVIKLSHFTGPHGSNQRNIREFVECKDNAPPDWQGNAYLRDWLKDGARMTTLITGPGGSNVHIEKPSWFYDGPVPFDRVFVLQERPPKMKKFVSTKLLPIPTNPPADIALGADHCNQTVDSTIYTLVALTQERGRAGKLKKQKGPKTKGSKTKGPKTKGPKTKGSKTKGPKTKGSKTKKDQKQKGSKTKKGPKTKKGSKTKRTKN